MFFHNSGEGIRGAAAQRNAGGEQEPAVGGGKMDSEFAAGNSIRLRILSQFIFVFLRAIATATHRKRNAETRYQRWQPTAFPVPTFLWNALMTVWSRNCFPSLIINSNNVGLQAVKPQIKMENNDRKQPPSTSSQSDHIMTTPLIFPTQLQQTHCKTRCKTEVLVARLLCLSFSRRLSVFALCAR